ncbi:MAG: hypothetical protein ACTJGI_06775 [Corynebacterium casei]|uniref:hypothetical protein n=1 Tax=Corynebacterium casei TaxID=160386 RepID=UPI003F9055BB
MRFIEFPEPYTPTALLYGTHGGEKVDLLRVVAQFSEDTLEQIEEALEILSPLVLESRRAYMHAAAIEMVELTDVAKQEILDGEMPRMGHRSQATLHHRVTLTLVAFCSLQAFEQEETLKKIERENGVDSREWTRAKAIYHYLFDENLGYRILAKLRNILHHESMQVVNAKNSSWMEGPEKKNLLEFRINRQLMMKSRHVNKKLKSDLSSLPEDPRVEELIYQSLQGLTMASYELKPLMNKKYDWARDVLFELESNFVGCKGYRMLAETFPEKPEGNEIEWPQFQIIPPEILRESVGPRPVLRSKRFQSIPQFDPRNFAREIQNISSGP